MRTSIIFLSFFLVFQAITPTTVNAEPDLRHLVYLTEELPPYNYKDEGKATGLSVELLHLIWEELQLPESEIRFLPWSRAFDTTQHNSGHVLFTTIRTPGREALFKWVGPILEIKFSLMAPKNRHIIVKNEQDLAKFNISVISGYPSANMLQDLPVRRLHAHPKLDLIFQKLFTGRTDAIAIGEPIFKKKAKQFGYDPDDFEAIWPLATLHSCYAFSKDTPDSVIERFQKALDAVRKRPEYDALVTKYLP